MFRSAYLFLKQRFPLISKDRSDFDILFLTLLVEYTASLIRDHSISTRVKIFEKLTFFTLSYAHVHENFVHVPNVSKLHSKVSVSTSKSQ